MILSCRRILGEPWQRPSGDCVRRRKKCWRHCRGVPVLIEVDRTYEQRLTRCCIRIWLVEKFLAVFPEVNFLQPLALVVVELFDKVKLRVVRILTKFDVYDSLLFSLLFFFFTFNNDDMRWQLDLIGNCVMRNAMLHGWKEERAEIAF